MESATSRSHVSKDAGAPPWTQPLNQSTPIASERHTKTQKSEVEELRAYAESQGADLNSVRIQTQDLTATPPQYDNRRRCPEDRRGPADREKEAIMALFAYPRPSDPGLMDLDKETYYPGVSEERKEEMSRAREDLQKLGKQFETATKTQKGHVEAALEKCPKPSSADLQR